MKKRLADGEDIQFTYECMHREYARMQDVRVSLPDITFSTSMTIDLGGVTCLLEHRDSPHTRDAVFIHVKEDSVLIGGDAQYEDYYDNCSKYDPDRLADFIAWIRTCEFTTYLKGHDEPSISKEDFLKDLEASFALLSRE